MVSAGCSVSVIDQVIKFTALFVIWYPYFQYYRLIKAQVFRARFIQLANGPAQVKLPVRLVDLSKVSSIFYTSILRKCSILQIGQVKKLHGALVFERQEGQHLTDIIKSWHLVIHDLLS